MREKQHEYFLFCFKLEQIKNREVWQIDEFKSLYY